MKVGMKIRFRGTYNMARGKKDRQGIYTGVIAYIPPNREYVRLTTGQVVGRDQFFGRAR